MERRHQVFVSSTYQDLIEERQHVIHALLELDCIPAGMEMFPAADEDAWSLIKGVIDDSDYYLLILGGRYGSVAPSGLSYTEQEYDYAVSSSKPVIAFLHESPANLASGRCESSDEGRAKLEAFRKKVQQRHCKFWNNPDDLGGKVSRSLVQLKKRHPSPGWVPGKHAADEGLLRKMEELRTRISELETEAAAVRTGPPAGASDLEQGDDKLSLDLSLQVSGPPNGTIGGYTFTPSWDQIFAYTGPSLSGECGEEELSQKIRLLLWHLVPAQIQPFNNFASVVLPFVVFDQIKVQLQALGLMMPGTKRRAVSDEKRYWKLTPYGERYLIQLKARRKQGKQLAFPDSEATTSGGATSGA